MFVKHRIIRKHAERREHAKPGVQYQHSAATRLPILSNSKKVKWSPYFLGLPSYLAELVNNIPVG